MKTKIVTVFDIQRRIKELDAKLVLVRRAFSKTHGGMALIWHSHAAALENRKRLAIDGLACHLQDQANHDEWKHRNWARMQYRRLP
jgi:hypothetical protein